jgi:hypothetical protein
MNRIAAADSIRQRSVDVRRDQRKCCVAASSAECQPTPKWASDADPVSNAPVDDNAGTAI